MALRGRKLVYFFACLAAVSTTFGGACKGREAGASQTASGPAAAPALESAGPATATEGYRELLVVRPGAYPMNHGSTVVDLGDGTLMACWFAGSREAARDVKIPCSKLSLAALASGQNASWSQPVVAVDSGETVADGWLATKFVGNPVLFRDRDGLLWLFHETVQIGGHSGAYVYFKTSRDNGAHWSPSQHLAGGLTSLGHLPRNKPRQLGGRRFIVPLYREFASHQGYTAIVDAARLERGEDPVESTQMIPPVPSGVQDTQHLQPSLVFQSDAAGQYLRAYLRNKQKGYVLTSTMRFTDMQWSAPAATTLPNPDAAIDAVETEAGGVVIVYNDSMTARTSLSLAYSEDGVKFVKLHDIEPDRGQEASYPAIIVDGRGRYHVTYTAQNRKVIKHVTFTKEWLEGKIAAAR
jgi:predicted neuraminidase